MARTIIRDFFYGVVIFAILVSGIVGLMATIQDTEEHPKVEIDLFDTPGVNELVDFNETFNVYDELDEQKETLEQVVSNTTVKESDNIVSLAGAVIQTSWAGIQFIVSSFGFMNKAIEGLSAPPLNIPKFVPALIILLITLLFVFVILSIIFQKDI